MRVRYSYDGLAEPMIYLVVDVSPRVWGRYSNNGLAEPMNHVHPVLASDFVSGRFFSHGGIFFRRQLSSLSRVALFARRARRANGCSLKTGYFVGASYQVWVGSHNSLKQASCRRQLRSLGQIALFARRTRRADESRLSKCQLPRFYRVTLFAWTGNVYYHQGQL
jgi:hypothetical protein